MSVKQIHVFISHAWAHSKHYETLAMWIFSENWQKGQARLKFKDYSIPKSNPILNANNDRELKEVIFNHISPSHVVVIPMGMYANYSKWIRKEINGAKGFGKPILAVDPWGQKRTSSVVGSASTKKVGWNKNSVVNAIWELYKEGQN